MSTTPARLLLIVLTISLAACATHKPASRTNVTIAPGLEFAMPTGRELGYSVEATQLITAHFHDQVQVFQAYVSVSPEKITMIALDPLGGRALTITATDEALTFAAAPTAPAALRPGNILADLAIVYWPAPAVRRALAGSSASLDDDQSGRTIILDGRVVVQVTYEAPHENTWTKLAHLHNLEYGYELDLQSAVTGP
ncbi:MAG TPA: DUF3261 domain-containing protein [Candidatus Binataceae bacterium]|nr:DUF3261 domain-containing protein [Candidatus Binataceae bacterium]